MRQEERSYLNRSLFPEKGEDFIIYIDIQNDLKYRWSLDRYVLMSTPLQKSIADKEMVSYIIKKDSAITNFELKDNKYLILTYTDNEGKEQSINIDLSVVVADNYVDLISNQDIGGIKTFIEKTLFKKDINVSGDGIFGGEVVAIVGDGTPVGVTDYSALTGKPSINGKELTSGENSLIELGIQPAGNYALQDNLTAHTEDNTRHISEEEREAWNKKWDYNEETIKNILANNYVDLINNQDIGGIKTFIDKTIFKKDINVAGDAVVGGEVEYRVQLECSHQKQVLYRL